MHENFKGRVHIIGKRGDVKGYMLRVYDVETGEEINGVKSAELHLDALSENWVTLTYYAINREDSEKEIRLPDPEIDLTAYYHSSEAWE